MIPLWLMIAQGAKSVADNQNATINDFNANQQYNPNQQYNQQQINPNLLGNNSNGLGNAFTSFSSIYGNFLADEEKKKKLMGG